MSRLRHRTELLRRSVDQDGRVILGKNELDDGDRCVQIVVPESPKVYMAIGPHPDKPAPTGLEGVDNAGALPEDVAFQRTYQWAELDGGQTYPVTIQANQWIAVMAAEGTISLAVFVEYPAD